MRTFIATVTAVLLHSTAFGGVPTYYPITSDEVPAVEANTDSEDTQTVSASGRVGNSSYNVYEELGNIQYNYKRGTDVQVLRERIRETYEYDITDEYYNNLRSNLYYLIEDRFLQKSLFINRQK